MNVAISIIGLLLFVTDQGKTVEENVSFKSGEDTLSAWLVRPEGEGRHPAVIVIHEWWGLNDHIKGVARKLAREGYAALCVDLYRGQAAKDSDEAHQLMRGLPEDRATKDLKAAFAYLKMRQDVKGDRIGSIGWCMGGGYSLTLAVEESELAACTIFYGRLLTDKEKLGKIKAPVLGLFGDQDKGIPVESVKKFESTLKELKKNVETKIYAGAGHAFANDTRPSYSKEAAEDAWKLMLEHFKKYLKK